MGVYDVMRADRKRDIVEAAKKLIIEKGVAGTQMSDVATAVGVSRQTLYKYFDNIDALAYAAQMEILMEMRDCLEAYPENGKNALEKIKAHITHFFEYADSHSNEFLFISLFDAYYNSREVIVLLDEDYRSYIDEVAALLSFRRLIGEGISDGSVRADVGELSAAITLLNMAIAIAQRLSLLGRNGVGISEIDKHLVINETVIAIEKYLKN